jgi:hypothetical protein
MKTYQTIAMLLSSAVFTLACLSPTLAEACDRDSASPMSRGCKPQPQAMKGPQRQAALSKLAGASHAKHAQKWEQQAQARATTTTIDSVASAQAHSQPAPVIEREEESHIPPRARR